MWSSSKEGDKKFNKCINFDKQECLKATKILRKCEVLFFSFILEISKSSSNVTFFFIIIFHFLLFSISFVFLHCSTSYFLPIIHPDLFFIFSFYLFIHYFPIFLSFLFNFPSYFCYGFPFFPALPKSVSFSSLFFFSAY